MNLIDAASVIGLIAGTLISGWHLFRRASPVHRALLSTAEDDVAHVVMLPVMAAMIAPASAHAAMTPAVTLPLVAFFIALLGVAIARERSRPSPPTAAPRWIGPLFHLLGAVIMVWLASTPGHEHGAHHGHAMSGPGLLGWCFIAFYLLDATVTLGAAARRRPGRPRWQRMLAFAPHTMMDLGMVVMVVQHLF